MNATAAAAAHAAPSVLPPFSQSLPPSVLMGHETQKLI